jgi:hypothetical protein
MMAALLSPLQDRGFNGFGVEKKNPLCIEV